MRLKCVCVCAKCFEVAVVERNRGAGEAGWGGREGGKGGCCSGTISVGGVVCTCETER